MAGDPGMAYLNMLLDAEFELHFRRAALREKEGYRDDEADMDPSLEEQSSAASGKAQDKYEEDVIFEARAIVEGVSNTPPTAEHLRVLLERCATSALLERETLLF